MRSLLILLLVFFHVENASSQMLWGMTPGGGANNKGTIFSMNVDGSGFTVWHHFTDESGWGPEGGLCLAPNGMIYGATTLGGEAEPAAGTLFKIDPATGSFTKLMDFNISNGGYSWGSLIVGGDGLLYGASYGGGAGGGSIYRLDPADDTYEILYGLNQNTDGGAMNSRLLELSDGVLYGTASQGGANSQAGTVFKYDVSTDVFTKIHDFDGTDNGNTPYGGLTLAENGWLYGTTFEGGLQNKGIVYRIHPFTHEFEKIKDMADLDLSNCWSSFERAGTDRLLATVPNGGLNGGGAIIQLTPSTNEVIAVSHFAILVGSTPFSGLTADDNDQLFGITSFGGALSGGNIFKFDPVTMVRTTLHDLDPASDGAMARGELVLHPGAVGISETDDLNISIWPQPSDGQFSIAIPHYCIPAKATIHDAMGKVIEEVVLTADRTELHLDHGAGFYVLSIRSKDRMASRILVVQ